MRTSPSGTPPASRACTACSGCAPSRALSLYALHTVALSPLHKLRAPRSPASSPVSRPAHSSLRTVYMLCLRPSTARGGLQPASELRHFPRHKHVRHVLGELLPAPSPPCDLQSLPLFPVYARCACTADSPAASPASRPAARLSPCVPCLRDRRQGARAFNQPLTFDLSSITDMSYIFNGAPLCPPPTGCSSVARGRVRPSRLRCKQVSPSAPSPSMARAGLWEAARERISARCCRGWMALGKWNDRPCTARLKYTSASAERENCQRWDEYSFSRLRAPTSARISRIPRGAIADWVEPSPPAPRAPTCLWDSRPTGRYRKLGSSFFWGLTRDN